VNIAYWPNLVQENEQENATRKSADVVRCRADAALLHRNRSAPAEGTMSDVLIEALEDGLLTLTLNRPERRNALDTAMLESLVVAMWKGLAERHRRFGLRNETVARSPAAVIDHQRDQPALRESGAVLLDRKMRARPTLAEHHAGRLRLRGESLREKQFREARDAVADLGAKLSNHLRAESSQMQQRKVAVK
jgi:hypothetical protein